MISAALIITVSVNAQTIKLDSAGTESDLHITAILSDLEGRLILSSIEDGHRTVIAYQIKIFRENTGFWSILGDRLTGEATLRYEAWYDAFAGMYVLAKLGAARGGQRGMSTPVVETARFLDEESFLKALFAAENQPFSSAIQNEGNHYCLARARIAVVEFPPPLTILTPFVRDYRIETPWARKEL